MALVIGPPVDELSGLRWQDVRFGGGDCDSRSGCPGSSHIHVEESMQRVNGSLVRTPPIASVTRGRRPGRYDRLSWKRR